MNYAIITDNGGGEHNIYHDVEGEVYTFPKTYKKIIEPGTKVVYHRAGKKKGVEIPNRLHEESHYFGTAEIGKVEETADGNFQATILNYEKFVYPVLIKRGDGTYYEEHRPNQNGVRRTTEKVYDAICEASKIPPKPKEPKGKQPNGQKERKKGQGITTCESLKEDYCSNGFGKDASSGNYRYEVVIGNKAMWLKNRCNGIYYMLGKVNGYFGRPQVSASREGNFAIFVNGSVIGILTPIDNGLHFDGIIDGKKIDVNICM